jgi:hypothetical protein
MRMPFQSISISEAYSSLMSALGHGHPLYQPELDRFLPTEYTMKGVGIGDVGVIQDGSFDYLFNVYTPQGGINPPQLPCNFEMLKPVNISDDQYFLPGTHVLSMYERVCY